MVLRKGDQGYNESLKMYKKDSIKCAKDLYYPSEIIGLIQKAESKEQVDNILASQRRKI